MGVEILTPPVLNLEVNKMKGTLTEQQTPENPFLTGSFFIGKTL